MIKAAIIIPKFEAHHLNSTGDSILINFTPTFLEAMKYETFVVKNISSRSINFIALGHINEELIDILVKIIVSLLEMTLSILKIFFKIEMINILGNR